VLPFSGFCHGIMFNPPMVVIYEYFDKYKSLASGLSMCGHSLSSFTMVVLYRYSIDYYGWRGAMVIMAGMALNGCVCGMTFVPNVERKKPDNQQKKSSMFSGLKSWNYALFVMANAANKCQMNVLLLLTTSRAVSKGLSVMQGSMLISCVGIASTVTRFFVSWVSNMKCTSHIALYAASIMALSGMMVVSCIQPENIIFIATATALCGSMLGKLTELLSTCLFC
jgi:MCP family monocarboxylic acid transporter-like MFS transporter 12